MRPAAPGPRLASGRLRVDAARAIAKLREYQLPDAAAWIVEGVRAAVASGAERVVIDGDSNDVWLSWEGPPWPREVLPRLLDELVSPEPSRDAQHLRLLATAINSGLGLDPAYIDIFSIDPGGAASVVRYTPEVLELPDGDDEEPALRQLQCRPAERPRRAPAPGMHLHLRRRAGLETLGTFLRRADPPEIPMAIAACRDTAIPVTVADRQLGRDRITDRLRVELGEGLDGFLALLDPALATNDLPVAEIAERGAVIARYSLDLGVDFVWRPAPVRLYVDGPRMPVNASRSAVRRDAFPVADAERRAKERFAELVHQLITELSDEETGPVRRGELREAALALLASVAVGPNWPARLRGLKMPLAALAGLPLVKSATGRPVPVSSRWSPNVVHDGREPLDPELEPWLSDVLWTPPGDAAARLVEGAALDGRSLRGRVKRARRRLKNQRRFFASRTRELAIGRRSSDWIRAEIGAAVDGSAIGDERVAGSTGELVLSRRGLAEVTLVYEGRPLETLVLDTAALGTAQLGFRARVSHPRLQPADSFRAAVRDDAFTHAINAVAATAVRAIEALAMAGRGDLPPEGFALEDHPGAEELAPLIRAALLLAERVGGELSASTPLWSAPAWPSDGELFSVDELRGFDVLGVSLAPFSAPGRPVIVASIDERELLESLIGEQTRLIIYDPMRVKHGSGDFAKRAARELRSETGVATLEIREVGQRGAIAWGVRRSNIEAYHAGAPVTDVELPPLLTTRQVAVDCDGLVPLLLWNGLSNPEVLEEVVASWERQMARAVARALCGEVVEGLTFNRTTTLDRGAGLALCKAIAGGPETPEDLLGPELCERLRDASICTVLGEVLPISPRELAGRFNRSIPVLRNFSATPMDGFTPLMVVDKVEADAISRLIGVPNHAADDQLARLRAEVAQRAARERHLSRPALPAPELGPRDVALETDELSGVVRLGGGGALEVNVRVEGRHLATLSETGLPMKAVVEAPWSVADETFDGVRVEARREIISRVRRLADQLLWRSLSDGNEGALAGDERVVALVLAMLLGGEIGDRDRDRLRRVEAFPTVQGGVASIEQAEMLGLVRVASWGGEWLGPESEGEAEALDLPVLQIRTDDAGVALRNLVDALAREGAIDETRLVGKLQVSRAMSRGMLSRPVVPGAVAAVTRELDDLGTHGKSLGAGEIALVADTVSKVLVHELGVFVGEIEVDVTPPIHVALEAPDLVDQIDRSIRSSILASRVQRAAGALVSAIAGSDETLPEWVDRGLVTAVLSGAVEPGAVGDRPIFETTAGERVPIGALREQARMFGDVWYVTASESPPPLEPKRIVIKLDAAAEAHANDKTVALVEASEQLALDAEARANRDREPVSELALPGEVIVAALDVIELDGDGLTAPRGRVAVLAPDAGGLRGVAIHREMKPLGTINDPCEWPTYAVVDDARLTPDRTWSAPELDEALRRVRRAIQKTTEQSLTKMCAVPRDALSSRVIWNLDRNQPGCVGRGRLWLSGTWDNGTVVAEHFGGELRHHPTTEAGTPLPVSGKVMVFGPPGSDIRAAIDQAARRSYSDLVRSARLLDRDTDLATAHAVIALDAGLVGPDDLEDLELSCFDPGPLEAAGLAELLADSSGARPRLVDDGSVTAHVLFSLLGTATSEASAPLPIEPDVIEADKPAEAEHPLAGLARAIAAGLDAAGVRHAFDAVSINAGQRAMVEVRDRQVTLAGGARMAAIEIARQSSSPWAAEAIDALVAHALTTLTEAAHLTAGEQMRAFERMLERGESRQDRRESRHEST